MNPTRRALLRRIPLLGLAGLQLPALAQPAYEVTPWPRAQATPRMEATALDGKAWKLEGLRGRAVLLNFWASWCEPCRAEMPTLQQLADITGPEKLAVLAINFKESANKAKQFAASTGLDLPILLDPAGDIAKAWGVKVFPTTILVGADGKPRHRVRGEMDWTGQEARRLLAPLLP
jgi:thiol-disulfide isomerase/thioredoxin